MEMFYKCINVEMIGQAFVADTDNNPVSDMMDLHFNISIEGKKLLKKYYD